MSTTAATHMKGTGAPGRDPARGLVSLHPEDGLFLRAEHLSTIQDYARALAMAVGQAAGSGVVWGLELRIDKKEKKLLAAPGLAVNGLGLPLLSRVSVSADLPKQSAAKDQATGYWLVSACYDDELTGRENRYGNLCDDGCGCAGGATIRPFRAEGIKLQVQPQSEPGLGDQDPERRRSWLASWYFEQERRHAEPWLTRGTESEVVGSRLDRRWNRGPGEPTTPCVPLGVLLRIDDRFVVDTWTARRDIGMGYADDAWRWRLGMRPWNVFMAQVLQFQDQLTGFVADLVSPATARRWAEQSRWTGVVERLLELHPGRDDDEVRKIADEWESLSEPYARFDGTVSLYDQGFDELPPAGFLPGADSEEELERRLDELFDGRVAWRICSSSADAIARAVDHAQHLDRIPLAGAKNLPEVDILVPDRVPDLPALRTTYGWVAFVRRRAVACRVGVDDVDVYVVELPTDREERELAREGLVEGAGLGDSILKRWLALQKLEQIGTLHYPQDTWEFPGGDVAEALGPLDARVFAIVAVPREPSRGPLTALRAQLFAASFIRQPVHVVVLADEGKGLPPPEALVLILRRKRRPDDGGSIVQPEVAVAMEAATAGVATEAEEPEQPEVVEEPEAEAAEPEAVVGEEPGHEATAAKETAAKRAAAKKAPAKKALAKQTTARKTAAGQPAARKRAARKTTPRKTAPGNDADSA